MLLRFVQLSWLRLSTTSYSVILLLLTKEYTLKNMDSYLADYEEDEI